MTKKMTFYESIIFDNLVKVIDVAGMGSGKNLAWALLLDGFLCWK